MPTRHPGAKTTWESRWAMRLGAEAVPGDTLDRRWRCAPTTASTLPVGPIMDSPQAEGVVTGHLPPGGNPDADPGQERSPTDDRAPQLLLSMPEVLGQDRNVGERLVVEAQRRLDQIDHHGQRIDRPYALEVRELGVNAAWKRLATNCNERRRRPR